MLGVDVLEGCAVAQAVVCLLRKAGHQFIWHIPTMEGYCLVNYCYG